jgi:ribonuclease HIII
MNYVFNVDEKNLDKLKTYYQRIACETSNPTQKHLFKSDDLTITVYKSNKVMFQGLKALEEYNKWSSIIGYEPLKVEKHPVDYDNQFKDMKAIGSDEVGTGDFFGPVIVTAAYIEPKEYPLLKSLNVRDSKKMSDNEIIKTAEILIKTIDHQVLITPNTKYNELVSQGFNLNKIKAYLHNHAIKKMINLSKDYQVIIIDQFCSEKKYFEYLQSVEAIKDVTLVTQAESVHMSVAVAAIISRYHLILEFEKLSKKIGIELPKGASGAVDAIAKVILLKHGIEVFNEISKLNFKNYEKIKELRLF